MERDEESLLGQFSGATSGTTPRPEGEKQRGTPASSEPGEDNGGALANGSTRQGHQYPGSADLPQEAFSVVRATGKIEIDMALLAEDHEAHIARVKQGEPKRCGGPAKCTACRLLQEFTLLQRSATMASNMAMRAMWRLDADQVDRHVLETGSPKGLKWAKYTPADIEPVLRSISPGMPPAVAAVIAEKTCSKGFFQAYNLCAHVMAGWSSGIAAAVAKSVEDAWKKTKFDALVLQNRRPAHYTTTVPVPIRASEIDVVAPAERNGAYQITFPIRAGRGQQLSIPVKPRDKYQALLLRELASGAVRCGAAKLEQDRLRRSKWYLRIAYTRLVEPAKTRLTATVHTGILCFAYAMTANGRALAYDGFDIEAYLKQIQRRRRQYQYDSKVSDRWGHGRERTLRPIEHLSGKAERWRKTKIQTIARRLARWLKNEGVGHVVLGDYTGIRDGLPERLRGGRPVWERVQEWPYFEMQTRIIACLQEVGISHEIRPVVNISVTCRKCGSASPEYLLLGQREFRCQACGHKEHIEKNAAHNLLFGLPEKATRKPASKSAKPQGSRGQRRSG